MNDSSRPIKNYVQNFLGYCTENGFSKKTQTSYCKFLNKFVLWLEREKYDYLRPSDLTEDHIKSYRSFLENGHEKQLSQATKNYYLIALRALLKYLNEQGLKCISYDKIILPKHKKNSSEKDYLTIEQINDLLLLPDIKTDKGLRDRAILECILSTGVKISELVAFDIGVIKQPKIYSDNFLYWLNKYLEIRNNYCANNEKSLFIHLNSKQCHENRLTAESIERLVKRYGKQIDTEIKITPELLRKSYFKALFSEEIIIDKVYCHGQESIADYLVYRDETIKKENVKTKIKRNNSWNSIETSIEKEGFWLQNHIAILPERFRGNHTAINCDNCLFRKIAILIVSGRLQAVEMNFEKGLFSEAFNNEKNAKTINRHGKDLHKKMMDDLYDYFLKNNYQVDLEPKLNYGRADLSVRKSNKTLFIEVGTVSPFKLWFNFMTMKGTTLIVVNSKFQWIKFTF